MVSSQLNAATKCAVPAVAFASFTAAVPGRDQRARVGRAEIELGIRVVGPRELIGRRLRRDRRRKHRHLAGGDVLQIERERGAVARLRVTREHVAAVVRPVERPAAGGDAGEVLVIVPVIRDHDRELLIARRQAEVERRLVRRTQTGSARLRRDAIDRQAFDLERRARIGRRTERDRRDASSSRRDRRPSRCRSLRAPDSRSPASTRRRASRCFHRMRQRGDQEAAHRSPIVSVARDRRVDLLRPGVDAAGHVVDRLEAGLQKVIRRTAAAAAVMAVERECRVFRQRLDLRPSRRRRAASVPAICAVSRSFGVRTSYTWVTLPESISALNSIGPISLTIAGRFGLSILKPAPVASSMKSIVTPSAFAALARSSWTVMPPRVDRDVRRLPSGRGRAGAPNPR